MIEVRDLYKDYPSPDGPIKAVDGVSFSVGEGEVYGIIGLSGAGKSTLVRCLNLLERPTSGQVIVDGQNLNKLNEEDLLRARQDIGMIFQHFNLFDQRNVYDNIAFPLEVAGMEKKQINERVREMLDFVGLTDRREAYPSQLSGGQKQRVAIARALATRPKVLLSDESTSALDPANTEVILKLLKESVHRYNMTIVMITHQMEVAKNICHRIGVMEDGKIIEENTVEQIFNNPQTARTRSFIDSLPDIAGENLNPRDFKGILVRLNFDEKTAKEPILSKVIRETDSIISVISGNLSQIGDQRDTVGYLIVEFQGSYKESTIAVNMLRAEGVNVEVLNG